MVLSFIFAATVFILDNLILQQFSGCVHQGGGISEFLTLSEAVFTKVN